MQQTQAPDCSPVIYICLMWEHWYWQGHILLLPKLLCCTDHLCFGVVFLQKAKKLCENKPVTTCTWIFTQCNSFLWPTFWIYPHILQKKKKQQPKMWIYMMPNDIQLYVAAGWLKCKFFIPKMFQMIPCATLHLLYSLHHTCLTYFYIHLWST